MDRPIVDAKRTAPATLAADDDPDIQPGEFCYTTPGKGRRFVPHDMLLFACPGCGRSGAIRAAHPKPDNRNGATWDITAGSLDDPTTLSLAPSINCVGCCGWHGYLTGGVFKSC